MKKLITGVLALLMCASCATACMTMTACNNNEKPPVLEPGDTVKPEGVLTWAQFTAAEEDAVVTVSGVITGLVNGDRAIYFEDADGAYYAYGVNEEVDISSLAVGMEISVTGKRSTYYGINEVKNATNVTVLNATPTTVQATDITAALETAEYDFTNKDLIAAHQSKVVTIKGVTILGQNKTENSYYDFSIGGSISYARISSSANLLTSAQTTQFETTVSENIAKVADVTGIVSTYNGQIYLIPVTADAFSNITTPNYTDAQKVAFEQPLVELSAVHFTNNVTTIDLPTTGRAYSDVTIDWASDDASAVVNEDGTLTVTLSEEGKKEVTLTATISCGEAEAKTVEFTLYLDEATNYVVDDYTEMPAVGTAFKLHLAHSKLNQELYFTGNMSGNYFETTTNPEEAVDVITELKPDTTNEYYLYFMSGSVKKYIYIYNADKNDNGTITTNYYINVGILPVQDETDIPAHTWSWNSDHNTFVTTNKFTQNYGDNSYDDYVFIGTSNSKTYNTLSASRLYYSYYYIARPANIINGDTATTDEKLAKDKKDLTFDVSAQKATVVGTAFGSTITWASNNNAIAIAADGTLTVTNGATDVEVTVTATLALNGESVTKEFVVTVDAAVASLPVEGQAYYLTTTYNGAGIYGKYDSSYAYLVTSGITADTASTFVFEKVDGATNRYYIKIVEADLYISINTTENKLKFVTDKTGADWTLDTAKKVMQFTDTSTVTVFMYYNSGSPRLSRYTDKTNNSSYPAVWFEAVPATPAQ